MNSDLIPSMTTIYHDEYGSNELQMPSWDMPMQSCTDGDVLGNESSSIDATLFNVDNQTFAQAPLHCSSLCQPHTGYETGSSSLDEILQDSAFFNHKLSIPRFKSEFPYPERTRTSKIKKNNKLSEKITILQKLVSPYGKADTASVLEDTSLYIKLLHHQIQDLFHFFVRSYDVARTTTTDSQGTSKEGQNLRSKGFCLVPLSFSR